MARRLWGWVLIEPGSPHSVSTGYIVVEENFLTAAVAELRSRLVGLTGRELWIFPIQNAALSVY